MGDPDQIRHTRGLLRGQADHLRVQAALREGQGDREGHPRAVQEDVRAAGHRAHHHVRVPGQGQDREALGHPAVEAGLRAPRQGDKDHRGGKRVPPGVHVRLQQKVRLRAGHGEVAFRPLPGGEGHRLLPVRPIKAGRRQRVEHRLQGQEAPARRREGERREDPAKDGDRRVRDEEGKGGRSLWRGGLGAPGDRGEARRGTQAEAQGEAEVHPGPKSPLATVRGQDQIRWKQIT